MEKDKKKSKNNLYPIIGVGLGVLVVGIICIVAFSTMKKGNNSNSTQQVGDLEIRFDKKMGSIMKLDKSSPLSIDEGLLLPSYKFTVKNTGKKVVTYEIILDELDYKNKYDEGSVQLAVTENGVTTYIDYVKDSGLVNATLSPEQSIEYELRVWIREDAVENKDSKFSSKITVKELSSIEHKKYTIKERLLDKENLGDGELDDKSEAGSYYIKGTDPKNYIAFGGELWRALKVNEDGSIKLFLIRNAQDLPYNGGTVFNPTSENTVAYYLNNTFLNGLTNIDSIVDHVWCTGDISGDICGNNVTAKVGMLNINEYKFIGANYSYTYTGENYYFLNPSNDKILTVNTEDSEDIYHLHDTDTEAVAAVHPVITIRGDLTYESGVGSLTNPYIIK